MNFKRSEARHYNANHEDSIGNYLLCVVQGLLKSSGSDLMRLTRLLLGEYALEVHQSDFLPYEKRKELLLELIRCLDKDNMSEEQFFEEILKIRSSDQVRHKLKPVFDIIRNREPYTSHNDQTMNDTFPESFERPYKKIKRQEEIWNYDRFFDKLVQTVFDMGEESEIDIIENENGKIIYSHVDYPEQRRDLEHDVNALICNDKYELKLFPKGLILSLLNMITLSLNRKDLTSMPEEYINNIRKACTAYPFFENTIWDE